MGKKSVIITGGTSGLGFELAKIFSNGRYDVWVTGRSLKSGLPEGVRLNFARADFTDLRQTAGVMKDLRERGIRFDIIVNNAAILGHPEYMTTTDGYECTFQVNFLSHLLANRILLDGAVREKPVTLATVTSPVYRLVNPVFKFPEKEDYNSFRVYALTKYLLLLLADYLKGKFPDGMLKLVKFNPGVFSSGIYRSRGKFFGSLYRIASPVLRSPEIPARKLYELIERGNQQERFVYNCFNRRLNESPELTAEAEKFLLACEQSVGFLC